MQRGEGAHSAAKQIMQAQSVAMLTIQNWPTVCVICSGMGTFSPRMPATEGFAWRPNVNSCRGGIPELPSCRLRQR